MSKLLSYTILLFLFYIVEVDAQSFTKDSLQFKVYTITSFKNSKVENIEVDRILCSYCSDIQMLALEQSSIRSTLKLIQKPENRLIEGKIRLTIFIRVRKEKFAKLKAKDTLR